MAKHTPGKWEATLVGSSSAGDEGDDIYEVIAGGRERVAEYLYAADARLVAAAPDLLASLREVLKRITPGSLASEVRDRAEAAIRAATPE